MLDDLLHGGLPPIVRDANRLLLAVEQCVRNFPRCHKYQIGAELRGQAMEVARLAQRAWRDRAQQSQHVSRLVWLLDEIKLSLQLAKTIHAFASFAQFEACARLAVQLGKQTGGWHRQLATSQRARTAGFSPPNSGQKPPAQGAIHPAHAARADSLSPASTWGATPQVKA